MIFIGSILYGFCNGYFGRDNYEDKRVEAIGADWIVARGVESGRPFFADYPPHDVPPAWLTAEPT